MMLLVVDSKVNTYNIAYTEPLKYFRCAIHRWIEKVTSVEIFRVPNIR